MFTKHRWDILNIQWYPVDDHPAITTAFPRSSYANALPFVLLTVSRPRPQSSCYKISNRTPCNTTTYSFNRATTPSLFL